MYFVWAKNKVNMEFFFIYLALGAVHKLRHPIRGHGGVSQKMTQDDKGVGGGPAKDDR